MLIVRSPEGLGARRWDRAESARSRRPVRAVSGTSRPYGA